MMATRRAGGVDGVVGCHQELAAAVPVIRCVVPTRGVFSGAGDVSAGTNMLAAARCGRANRPRRGSGQNIDRAAVSSDHHASNPLRAFGSTTAGAAR